MREPKLRPRELLATYWPVALFAPLLAVHVGMFDFVTDDAFISFVYARNLARHGQLVYNVGERVEGYTNFLWTVLLACCHAMGFAMERASKLLALGFSVGTLAVVARTSAREAWWSRLVAPALLVACTAFAAWTSGGLETAMFTFLLTCGVMLHLEDRALAAGVVFALSAMTRPEGALFFAIAAVHALSMRRSPVRFVLAFVAVFAPYFALKYAYYGFPFPNTYYAKAGGETARGVHYLQLFLADYGAWLVLALLVPVRPIARWQLSFAMFVVLTWHIVRFGGDFMGMHRFFVPLLPLTAMYVEQLCRALPRRVGPALAALVVVTFVWNTPRLTRAALSVTAPVGALETPGFLRRFARERSVVGRWFGAHGKRDDLLIVGGAGAEVFYADMRAIDVYGLTDAYIAHSVAPSQSYPGHQRIAPLDYLLSRRPDFLLFNGRIGFEPYVPSDAERDEWRARGFHWVSVHLPDLDPQRGNYLSFLKRRERALGPLPAEP